MQTPFIANQNISANRQCEYFRLCSKLGYQGVSDDVDHLVEAICSGGEERYSTCPRYKTYKGQLSLLSAANKQATIDKQT